MSEVHKTTTPPQNMSSKIKKNFYEFFAGGGMAHAGLGSEWQCVFANDFSAKKAATYAANWPSSPLHVGDVAKVTPSQLPGTADLAWASFPCQDLSLAGNGAGLDGDRSGTFWPFIKIIKDLKNRKPRIVAIENVYGAITSHNGKDFEAMIDALSGLGYRVGAMVIDAIHFLPQSRPRLFIVAIASSLHVPPKCVRDAPNPAWHPSAIVKGYNQLPQRLKEQWIWWDLPAPRKNPKTLDDIIEEDPTSVTWHSPEETNRLIEMMSPVNRHKLMQAQESGRLKVGALYRRTRNGVQQAEVRFDGVSGCLRTPGGGSSRQTLVIVNGSCIQSRLLSPREAARLMGLKDSYKLPSRYNDAYHLAGDGVAVPAVAHLTKHIFNIAIEHNRSVIGELKRA